MPKEQNTIGLSPAAAEDLRRVMDSGWFETEMDACRTAMGVALRRGIIATEEEMTGLTTKYNVGTFDRDGTVVGVLKALGCPVDDGLYARAERLIHAGLKVVADELEVDGTLLSDLLEKGAQSTQ